jgi:hypothetical protein
MIYEVLTVNGSRWEVDTGKLTMQQLIGGSPAIRARTPRASGDEWPWTLATAAIVGWMLVAGQDDPAG